MEFILENECLRVTLTTDGAQIKSVVRKSDAVEHIWQADPAVWGYHTPILFPYTGKVKDGKILAKGTLYENCPQHGFARRMEHTPVCCDENRVIMELTENAETLKQWPYRFRLISTFTLEEDTLHHTLTVENRDEANMPFGIGYHPAFRLPFDDQHTYEDYELRFDEQESPLCLDTSNGGLIGDKLYYLGKNIRTVALDQQLFANDSHCMLGLQSNTLGLYEKDTGRGVVCSIRNFPYVLIWSKPGVPKFVCIEPWHSLPSPINGSYKWTEKPAAAVLAPGFNWSTTLSIQFIR
jgi:aldose 1-epimerase